MNGRKEEQFWHTLQNLFVGVPVEGESGYINLMRLKTHYFQHAMRPALEQFVSEQLREFPDFREELFDKLYTFLTRYISEETGSIGFFFTPYPQSVYEQVYTDTQDVILFWKTQRLYFVKTDRLFRSMETEVDGFKFFFDASALEHKKANEKRELVFKFKQIRPTDGALVFTMEYSERGRQTSLDTIRRAIRDALGLRQYTTAVPSEATLERAFRVFQRQSEVDYFLCKDAKSFLREQFDLWLGQYLLGKPGEEPQTEWTETRLKQLQALKRIAYRVIDYIAAFEDELVKIWNKPKFVLNSNYVITLDRIAAQAGGWRVLEAILSHPNLEQQVQEWRELGMVDEDFTIEDLVMPPSEPLDLFSIAEVRGLITTGYHLPYNPDLVERAHELRKNPTPAEKKLWEELLRDYPYRVLRQRPIDHFIVDFYCPQLKLVIEVDGEQHYTDAGKQYDAERTHILESYGLRGVRFPNEMVLNRFEEVRAALIPPTPSPSPLTKGRRGAGDGGINPRYQYLPIDTRYFKDLELRILGLFDHLDDALDGWLIKSENYQALNTILPKWRGKVQCVYIDPPYNTGYDEFVYTDRFRYASWLTMMANRISLAHRVLSSEGMIGISIDENQVSTLRLVMNDIFGSECYKNEIVVRRGVKNVQAQFDTVDALDKGHECVLLYSKSVKRRFQKIFVGEARLVGSWNSHWRGTDRPTMRYELFGITPQSGQWRWGQERSLKAIENYQRMLRELNVSEDEITQQMIDDWVAKQSAITGEKVDLLRLSRNGQPEHYVPPSEGTLLNDLWDDIQSSSSRKLANL